MQIGFSLLDLALGGAQIFLVQLAAQLNQQDHEIAYFLHANRSDPKYATPSLIEHLNTFAAAVRHPRDLLGCDVIQLDGYHSLRYKLPYIFHLDHCVETYHSIYSTRRAGPIYPKHRIAVSAQVEQALGRPCKIIPPGILFPPLPASQEKEFDLAILGRIHPVKQHMLFLQICSLLGQQRQDLRAVIIGGYPEPGPYQGRVDAKIEQLRRLGINIHMTGNIPSAQVFDWLAKTRLLLVTSLDEGFGRMAVEALACGVPVIANPVGGLTEIIQDGQNGYLAQKDNPQSFCDLALGLLQDEALRQKLGLQGRMIAEQRYSLPQIAKQYEALYRQMITQP